MAFEHEFQARNFDQLWICFWGYQIFQETVNKITKFIHISN